MDVAVLSVSVAVGRTARRLRRLQQLQLQLLRESVDHSRLLRRLRSYCTVCPRQRRRCRSHETPPGSINQSIKNF